MERLAFWRRKKKDADLANKGKAMLNAGLDGDELAGDVQKLTISDKEGKKSQPAGGSQKVNPNTKKGFTIKKTRPARRKPQAAERTLMNEIEADAGVQAPASAFPNKRWTHEQDDALRRAVEQNEGKNWKVIAESVPGRTHVQCLQRWKKVLQPGLIKGHWTDEEDKMLIDLVTQEIQSGRLISWVAIAEHIPGRTAKQCRERWSLNLDPSIKRTEWEPAEDTLLMELHEQLGNKWAEISHKLPGRTENAVKTRFKSLVRAQEKVWTSTEDEFLIRSKRFCNSRWASISNKMPGRSKNAVRLRWKLLVEKNPELETPPEAHEITTSSAQDIKDLEIKILKEKAEIAAKAHSGKKTVAATKPQDSRGNRADSDPKTEVDPDDIRVTDIYPMQWAPEPQTNNLFGMNPQMIPMPPNFGEEAPPMNNGYYYQQQQQQQYNTPQYGESPVEDSYMYAAASGQQQMYSSGRTLTFVDPAKPATDRVSLLNAQNSSLSRLFMQSQSQPYDHLLDSSPVKQEHALQKGFSSSRVSNSNMDALIDVLDTPYGGSGRGLLGGGGSGREMLGSPTGSYRDMLGGGGSGRDMLGIGGSGRDFTFGQQADLSVV